MVSKLDGAKTKHGFKRAVINLFPENPNRTEEDVARGHKVDEILSLPDLVRFNAIFNGSHTFCVQQVAKADPVHISFRLFHLAVVRCCLWLSQTVEPGACRGPYDSSQPCSPIALFLESDIVVFIYVTALLRCNIPVSDIRVMIATNP